MSVLLIILKILKIIGIILLIVLGILLVALLLVLFVPVRYKMTVKRETGDETFVTAHIKVTWLMHILNIAFSYPEAAYWHVRVFCFTIFRSDRPKEETNSQAQAEDVPLSAEASKTEQKKEPTEKREEKSKTEETSDMEEIPKVRIFFKKFIEILKNIKYTIIRICDKIKHIVKNVKYYLNILQSETFHRAFSACKTQVIALWKCIKPRKLDGNLIVGTNDPATTGQIMAIYGILYPLIGNNITVTPDFEQEIVEGNLLVKGRITVFTLIRIAWIIYFNKDIRRIVKLFKREAA